MSFNLGQLRALYDAAQSNTCLEETFTSERDALALEIATSPDAGREVTSGTANGLTFSAEVTLTKFDRLALLNLVLKHLDAGVPPTSRSYMRF